jgi:hypothetical protein
MVSFERVGREVFLPSTLVPRMRWTKEQHTFAVEAYFSNGPSIVATQRAFRAHFNNAARARVPGRQSIIMWANTFRIIQGPYFFLRE